jgi:signal transduction histidine kinase
MSILVVDDDDNSRVMLTNLLEGSGFSVIHASDGEEAWQIMKLSPPDMVITDIMMPRMDGYSLCQKIKGDPELKNTPVIFYSATYVLKMDEELARSMGGTSFIVKPQEPEVLLNTIHQVIKEYSEGNISSLQKTDEDLGKMHFKVLSDKLQEKIDDLEKVNHELQERNEELQDFLHIVSHDFQEPLRKIYTFGDRLNELGRGLSEKGSFYMERLQHSVKRMQGLMNDLVSYSKIVPSKSKSFQSVALEDIVQEVLIDLEIMLNETGGKVEIKSLPTIEADPFQMRGLFQNLISNSLKYHKEKISPLIKIEGQSSTSKNGFYEIRVQDNGIGFDDVYIPRIFKPFERLHREGEFQGTGMGLTLCKKIVERHGGSIDVKSKTNEGTTFKISLPLKQS